MGLLGLIQHSMNFFAQMPLRAWFLFAEESILHAAHKKKLLKYQHVAGQSGAVQPFFAQDTRQTCEKRCKDNIFEKNLGIGGNQLSLHMRSLASGKTKPVFNKI